jgi:hypothetical protein
LCCVRVASGSGRTRMGAVDAVNPADVAGVLSYSSSHVSIVLNSEAQSLKVRDRTADTQREYVRGPSSSSASSFVANLSARNSEVSVTAVDDGRRAQIPHQHLTSSSP